MLRIGKCYLPKWMFIICFCVASCSKTQEKKPHIITKQEKEVGDKEIFDLTSKEYCQLVAVKYNVPMDVTKEILYSYEVKRGNLADVYQNKQLDGIDATITKLNEKYGVSRKDIASMIIDLKLLAKVMSCSD